MVVRSVRGWIKAVVVGAALAVTQHAHAALWGPDGHRIVAQIAYDNLTPKTKTAVDGLLDGDSLPGVANWADEVRTKAGFTQTGPWHFADMDEGEDTFSLSRDCPSEGCVVQAILDCSANLANANLPKSERQEALRFLVHFVGDVHQPLHTGHKADRGGNDITVKFFNSSSKLHGVWDSGLIKRRGKSWDQYAKDLETGLTQTHRQEWTAVIDPVQWATESHHLAEEHAYRSPTGGEIAQGDALGSEYFNDAIGIVDEQLTKGGLRLAAMLNAIYDGPSSDRTATPAPERNGNPTPAVKFVGSRRSQTYHLPDCKDVDNIDPDNLVEYTEAPPGKHLHSGCPRH